MRFVIGSDDGWSVAEARIAPCRPVDTSRVPAGHLRDKLPPALIDDTLDTCADCGGRLWAAPNKRFLKTLGQARLVCWYPCLIPYLEVADEVAQLDLNPDREERRRV